MNFYRRFIPKFADIAAPLTPLTGSNATFKWDTEQQTAFRQLQQAMISPPLLDYPRSNDHFILTTDASEVGLGAVLSTQRGTTIEFASRVLSPPETKYCTRMFSYRVGSQEVLPLSDWDKVHSQD